MSAPRYRVELIPRTYTIAVYDDAKSPDNYCATAQAFKYGDVGDIYAIVGRDFYAAFSSPGQLESLMDRLGVSTLEGYAMRPHARLLARALRHVATVDVRETPGRMEGRDMVWMIVRRSKG